MARTIDLEKLQNEAEEKAAGKVRAVDLSNLEAPPPASENPNVHPLWEGVKQGATFGFSDELQAALAAALTDQTYREKWQELQAEIEAAKAANPTRFMAGQIGGGLATNFIPGVGIMSNALRGAKLAKDAALLAKFANAAKVGAKIGAVEGAISGVGTGGELGAQSITDAGVGAAMGAGAGALFSPVGVAAGEIAPKVINAVKEKVIQPALASPWAASVAKIPNDVAKEVIEDLPHYSRKKFQTTHDIGKDFVEKVNKLSDNIDAAKDAAKAHLSPDNKVIKAKEAGKILENALLETDALFKNKKTYKKAPEPGAEGPTQIKTKTRTDAEQQSVLNLVTKQKQKLKSMADETGKISETDLRKFLDGLKEHTKFDPRTPGASDKVASGYNKAFGRLNQRLRDNNSLYDEAMEPVREKTAQIADLAKTLGLKQRGFTTDEDAGRYVLSKSTLSKFKNIRNDDLAAEKLSNFAKLFPDTDFVAMAKRVRNERALEPKRISAGTILGAALDNKWTLGLGAVRDMGGPRIWRSAAMASDPLRTAAPEVFEDLVRRPMVNLFATPYPEQTP